MSRGHGKHVVNFANGRFLPVKFFAIPRCNATLPKRRERRHRRIVYAEHVVRAISKAM